MRPSHRGRGGGERLAEHLAAEHLRAADVAALAAKQVHLERLQLELLQQVRELCVHACQSGTPSRWCMIGLVVVYWRNCRFCG